MVLRPLYEEALGYDHEGDKIARAKIVVRDYLVSINTTRYLVVSPGNYVSSTLGLVNPAKHYSHWYWVIEELERYIPVTVNLHDKDTEVFQGLLQFECFSGSWLELQVLLAKSSGLLTVDSGPAHLGTLVNIPTLTILRRLQRGWPEGLARVATPLSNSSLGLLGEDLDALPPDLVVRTSITTFNL